MKGHSGLHMIGFSMSRINDLQCFKEIDVLQHYYRKDAKMAISVVNEMDRISNMYIAY